MEDVDGLPIDADEEPLDCDDDDDDDVIPLLEESKSLISGVYLVDSG